MLINTDLPEPVVPATNKCEFLKSMTSIFPDISLPIQMGIFDGIFKILFLKTL